MIKKIFYLKLVKNDPYEDIINHLTKKQADSINALDLDGLRSIKKNGVFILEIIPLLILLGFVGYQGDSLGGRYGLERKYDEVLSQDKDNPYVNFFAEVLQILMIIFLKIKLKKEIS